MASVMFPSQALLAGSRGRRCPSSPPGRGPEVPLPVAVVPPRGVLGPADGPTRCGSRPSRRSRATRARARWHEAPQVVRCPELGVDRVVVPAPSRTARRPSGAAGRSRGSGISQMISTPRSLSRGRFALGGGKRAFGRELPGVQLVRPACFASRDGEPGWRAHSQRRLEHAVQLVAIERDAVASHAARA